MRASVPSHITGFFSTRHLTDPMKSGSIGCGLTLDLMAKTVIEPAKKTKIFVNGVSSEAPVSRFVIDHLSKSPVRVETELDMPLGSGFGASGAGALSCAYVLDSIFDLRMTVNQIATIAHIAEIACGTGLGDVIAQNTGGLVIRLKAGAPGVGQVDRIPVPPLRVCYVVRGPISTREVLSDPKILKDINHEGKACLKDLLKRPTIRDFMRLSKRFTMQIGLASSWIFDAIEAVESKGGLASMIMLGDAIFAIDCAELPNCLNAFGDAGTAYISQRGASLD